MKNTKKIFALLFVVFTLAVMTLAVSAEEPVEFTFDVSTEGEVAEIGDTVTVTVSMENAPATVRGMLLRPLFDDTVLQLTSGKWGDVVTDQDPDFAINCKPTKGENDATAGFSDPVEINGEIFVLKFKVIAEGGETKVGVGVCINSENEEGDEEKILGTDDVPYNTIENGMSATIVTPEKVEVKPIEFTFDVSTEGEVAEIGDTVTVTVSMENAPATVRGMLLRPLFDDTVLQLTSGKWGDVVTDQDPDFAINCKPTKGENDATAGFSDPVEINGEIFVLKFKVIAEGGETKVGVGVCINAENEEGNEEKILGSDEVPYNTIENGMSGTIVTPEKAIVTPPSVEIDFITFNGYSARKIDYNGVRAQFTLDLAKLLEIEKNYKVEIGMLLTSTPNGDDAAEAAYDALTVDNNKQKALFYTTDDLVVGKYYDSDKNDNKIEYVYAVTFTSDGAETAEMFNRAISYRSYVILTDENGNSFTYYVDTESDTFGYAVSMNDLAEYYTSTADENYPILQRVVSVCKGSPLAKKTILNKDLDKFSIVINSSADMKAATDLNADLAAKIGYTLPIVIKNGTVAESAHHSDAYIYIDAAASMASNVDYVVSTTDGVATISAKDAATASTAAKKFVSLLAQNNYGTFAEYKHKLDNEWSDPIK